MILVNTHSFLCFYKGPHDSPFLPQNDNAKQYNSNKAQTHFPRIRKLTGIPYDEMLFFDDCNWGDHVGMVGRGCKEDSGNGVIGHRTPSGLKVSDWQKGLELYRKARS